MNYKFFFCRNNSKEQVLKKDQHRNEPKPTYDLTKLYVQQGKIAMTKAWSDPRETVVYDGSSVRSMKDNFQPSYGRLMCRNYQISANLKAD